MTRIKTERLIEGESHVPTKALYHEDAYIRDFEGRVVRTTREPDGIEVVLDQTAFYPESGGQPCDTGTLGGFPVRSVIERDGEIVHLLEANCVPEWTSASGSIDWPRRHDLMQQHCGQHILSAAFERVCGAATVGFHLTDEHAQIDLSISDLAIGQAEAAEEMANRVIWSPARIIVHWPDAVALAAMPLRKPPARTEGIRIVEVEGFDWSPCGGTHPSTAAEVGLVKVVRWEKVKGNTRVEFLCGQRAIADYRLKNRLLLETASHNSVGEAEIPTLIERLQESNRQMKKALHEASERLLDAEARELAASAEGLSPRLVTAVFASRAMEELRLLAAKLAVVPGTAAILASRNETARIAMARAEDVPAHMGRICQEILPLLDAKGGGSAQAAQCAGTRPDGVEPALELAAKRIREATGIPL